MILWLARFITFVYLWATTHSVDHVNALARFDVVEWLSFNASHVFMPSEHRNTVPLSGAMLKDITVRCTANYVIFASLLVCSDAIY